MTIAHTGERTQHVTPFERMEEFTRLTEAFALKRRSVLLFGDEGSGKTRLLQKLAQATEGALYIPQCPTPTDLLKGILAAIKTKNAASVPKAPSGSIRNIKGIVQQVLSESDWLLIIDHVQSPSLALGHLAKELNYYGRTPIAFAGRSEHMEDIGNFRTFCTDRSSRIELKSWPAAVALEFARQQAANLGLQANNLEEALQGIATMSNGYPGPIVKMLRMAKEPGYRRDGQIKFHVVWLDYRLRGTQPTSGNMKPNAKH